MSNPQESIPDDRPRVSGFVSSSQSTNTLFSPRPGRGNYPRNIPRTAAKKPANRATLVDNTETVDYSDDSLVSAVGDEWGMEAYMIDAAAAHVPTVDEVVDAGIPPESVYGTQPTSRPFDVVALTPYDMHNPAHLDAPHPTTRPRSGSASGLTNAEKDSRFLSSVLLELQAMFGHDLLAIGSGITPSQPIVAVGTTRLLYPGEEDASYPSSHAKMPTVDALTASSAMLPGSPHEAAVPNTNEGQGNEGGLLADHNSHTLRQKTAAELSFLNSAWPTALRFLLCGVIGLLTSFTTYAVDVIIHVCFKGTLFFLNTFLGANGGINVHHGFDPTWLVLVLATAVPLAMFYAFVAVIAAFMGGYFPVVGAGLNHLNAYLSGSYNTKVPIFTFKVLVAKVLSVSLVLASGIKSGLQGPMIHVGSMIGRQTARLSLKMIDSTYFATALSSLLCCCIDKDRYWRTECCRKKKAADDDTTIDGLARGWEWLMIKSRVRSTAMEEQLDAVTAMELGDTTANGDGEETMLDGEGVMSPTSAAMAGAEALGVGANPFSLPDPNDVPVDADGAALAVAGGPNMHMTTSFKTIVDTRVRIYETSHIPLDMQDNEEDDEYEEETHVPETTPLMPPRVSGRVGESTTTTSSSSSSSAPIASLTLNTPGSNKAPHVDPLDSEALAYYTALRQNPSLSSGHAAALAAASTPVNAPVESDETSSRPVSLTIDSQLALLAQALRNPTDEHDFLVCGAAAGFTCAFNAPLAGIIMVQGMIKQAHSWQLTLRMFFCVLLAVISTNLIGTNKHILPDRGFIDLDIPPVHAFDAYELYICVILGILGGVGAVLFTNLTFLVQRARTKLMGHRLFPNIQYAMFVAAAATVPGIIFAVFGSCTPISDTSYPVCVNHPTRCLQLACPDGHISEWATLLFAFPEKAVRLLWDRSHPANEFPAFILAIYCIIYTCLACASYAVATPGGLFMPAIILGAALGRTVARLAIMVNFLDKGLIIGVYGALGSVAVLSGVNRLTLPMAVMMVEFTSDTQFLIPIMIVIMLSKFTADHLSPSLEAQEATLRQTYLSMGEKPSVALARATAADVLSASSSSRLDKPAPAPVPAPVPVSPTDYPHEGPDSPDTQTDPAVPASEAAAIVNAAAAPPAPRATPAGIVLPAANTPSWWRNVCCVGEIDTVARLRAILEYSPHSAFPVVSVLPHMSNKGAMELAHATRRGDRSAVVNTAAKVRRGLYGGDVGVGVLVGVVTRRKLEYLVAKGGVQAIANVLNHANGHTDSSTTSRTALQTRAKAAAARCPTWTRHEGPVQALMFAHLTRARALSALAKLYISLARPCPVDGSPSASATSAFQKLTPMQRAAIASNALALLVSLPPPPMPVVDAIEDAIDRHEHAAETSADALESGVVSPTATATETTPLEEPPRDPFSWLWRAGSWIEAQVEKHSRKAKQRAESSIPATNDEDANDNDGEVAPDRVRERRPSIAEGRARSASFALRNRTSSMSLHHTHPTSPLHNSFNMGTAVSEPAVWVNVGTVAHRDTPIATTHTPAVKLWKLFRHVGMRRMVLVDTRHRPVGIVTRKDMIIGEKTLTKKMDDELKKK